MPPTIFLRPPPIRSHGAFAHRFHVPSPPTSTFEQLPIGPSGAFLSDPTWASVSGELGPLIPLFWRRSRFLNRAGTWEMILPVDEQPISGAPVQTQITTGWHVSLVQEGTHPDDDPLKEHLLYQGEVLDRHFEMNEGSVQMVLKGASRLVHLAERSTHAGLEYTGSQNINEIAADLIDGNTIIGPNGGGLMPSGSDAFHPELTFNDITLLAALLKVGEIGRYYLRESWDYDKPEFTKVDGPPDSGYVFRRVEAYDPGQDDAAERDAAGRNGTGIIAGTPRVHYVGTEIINRIVAYGSDTHTDPDDDSPLTLEHSDPQFWLPEYPVEELTNPDGTSYWFVIDTTSQTTYGIKEAVLVRTDVKNPTDDDDTREAAANVLYAIAVNQLMKHKSEVMVIDLEIANGSNVWALPGDMVRVDLVGWVETDAGKITWVNLDNKQMIVTERHDESHPSGVRKVRFTLAAPVIAIPIPDLPTDDDRQTFPLPPFPGPLPLPPLPEMPPLPDCCDDPTTDNPGGTPGDPGNFPEPPSAAGFHEEAVIWRSTPFNFISGSAHLPGFRGTYPDMDATPFWVRTHEAGDHIIRYVLEFQNHAILGVNGAEYNVVVGVGATTETRNTGVFNKGDTVRVSGRFMARDLGAGVDIGVDFQAVVGTTLILSPNGVGLGFVDNGFGGEVMHPDNSVLEIQRYTNVPLGFDELV